MRQALAPVDPLADQLLVMATLVWMVPLGRVEAWVVVLLLTREISITALRAIAGAGLRDPVDLSLVPEAPSPVAVAIEDLGLCPRYSALVVDNITVQPSPLWLQYRLEAIGLNPINNIVDVTNFVMAELAQPMHAFDLDRLPNKKIRVRTAKEIKKFTTLDGVERELAHEDLLICDGDLPVAGVLLLESVLLLAAAKRGKGSA